MVLATALKYYSGMRIVLFHPRGYSWTPQRDIHSLACIMPPLGLASIAAVLRKAGHEVTILDAAIEPSVRNSEWAQRIAASRPNLVGFSAVTATFLDAYDVCTKAREIMPDVKIAFGGVHVSWGKNLILQNFPAIDFVVAGEGETSFRSLADGNSPLKIQGLYYRDGSAICNGPPQTIFCSMDDLPFPAYDLLPGFPRKYLMPLFGYPHHPGANIVSSRGCVYQCTYCDRSVFGKTFRWNSPEYTFEQMRWLRTDFGVRHVNFYDDLFTLNRARVAALCEKLASSKLSMTFNCIVRVGHIDAELIGLLKRAGCWMVHAGIESGDQTMLDSHKDGLSLDKIREDIHLLHDSGLWVKGLFMMGFPGETEESIAKTRDLAYSLPLKDANVTAFTPFPGAPISASIEESGELDNDWSKMDCEHFVFVPESIGSREKLERLRDEFIAGFYQRKFMRGVYRKMFRQSPHSYWRMAKSAAAFWKYARSMKKIKPGKD